MGDALLPASRRPQEQSTIADACSTTFYPPIDGAAGEPKGSCHAYLACMYLHTVRPVVSQL